MILATCEICTHRLGYCDPARMDNPMRGSDFTSPDQAHGFPAPFPGVLTWLDLRCPMCRRRPFLREDAVRGDDGRYHTLGRPVAPRPKDQGHAERMQARIEAEWGAGARGNETRAEPPAVDQGFRFWCEGCQFGTNTPVAWSGHCRSKKHRRATERAAA